MNVTAFSVNHVDTGPPAWWGSGSSASTATWVLLRRIATLMVATAAFLIVVVGVGQAAEPLAPTLRLDCDHAAQGCAGMNGDFSSPDGAAITSVAVEVRDLTANAVHDVPAIGCRMRTQAENPSTTRVHCMVEGAKLGIAGYITWSVAVNGSVVWTSPATPTRCEVVEEEPAREVDVPPPPIEPTPEEPAPAPEIVTPPPPAEPDQPIIERQPVVGGPGVDVPVHGDVAPAVRPVQTRASSTPPVYTVRVSPEPVRTAVSAVGQETLPETGISLGLLTGIGIVMLAAGLAVERRTRPPRLA